MRIIHLRSGRRGQTLHSVVAAAQYGRTEDVDDKMDADVQILSRLAGAFVQHSAPVRHPVSHKRPYSDDEI